MLIDVHTNLRFKDNKILKQTSKGIFLESKRNVKVKKRNVKNKLPQITKMVQNSKCRFGHLEAEERKTERERKMKPFQIRPRGYKTFFMLNFAKHEHLNAYKHKFIKNCRFYRLR